jgi:predicted DNA-binding transcriptional regulator AlpA
VGALKDGGLTMHITAIVSFHITGLAPLDLARVVGALHLGHASQGDATASPPIASPAVLARQTERSTGTEAVRSPPATVARTTLEAAGPDFVSFSHLGRLLGITRAAIHGRVKRASLPAPTRQRGTTLGWRAAEIDKHLAKLAPE